jgi:internalin A
MQVTDNGLDQVKGLSELTTLSVRSTKVTDAGVQKIQQALPNCRIRRMLF